MFGLDIWPFPARHRCTTFVQRSVQRSVQRRTLRRTPTRTLL